MYKISNNINTDWKSIIDNEMQKSYFNTIIENLKNNNNIIYPKPEDVFNAFNYFNVNDTKIVILGQDPYINENQAHGLAFSVKNNIAPKSLINIFKELESDLGIKRINPDLTDWAEQGILLLNTILTVDKGNSLSHKNYGWQNFTINIIKYIDNNLENIVFVLWGNDARKYKEFINKEKHLIIESSHPSPLGAYRGFFGSRPFSKINLFLCNKKNYNIKW